METKVDGVSVTDDELAKLPAAVAKALFARSEAEGAGDLELTVAVRSEPDEAVVESYEVVTPEWSSDYLRAVQDRMNDATPADIERLSADVGASPAERRAAVSKKTMRVEATLDNLLRHYLGSTSQLGRGDSEDTSE
jgi:hypothetical protein